MENIIAKKVLDFYLTSPDFNGIPISNIIKEFETVEEAKKTVRKLIEDDIIELYFDENNPHIKRFDVSKKKDLQLKFLTELPDIFKEEYEELIFHIRMLSPNAFSPYCLYPTETFLQEEIGDKKEFLALPPFKKMLSFGKAQLEFVYFRIDVLDRYLEDPRYQIRYHDFSGGIYFSHEAPAHKEDDTFLEHFGLAHNKQTSENLICVFIRDLERLSARHQSHFFSYMEEGQTLTPDPDYYRTSILAEFAECGIFKAFLKEIKIINQMTKIICDKAIFKKEFPTDGSSRPEYFHPFLKPTTASYLNFCRTLDRLFTDNLDKKCIVAMNSVLGNRMEINETEGPLTLLQTFLDTYIHPTNGEKAGVKVVQIWKKSVRPERSKVSHNFPENRYDISIFQKYRQILSNAYESIRFLRLLLANHPEVKNVYNTKELPIPAWLFKGDKIRNYFLAPNE